MFTWAFLNYVLLKTLVQLVQKFKAVSATATQLAYIACICPHAAVTV